MPPNDLGYAPSTSSYPFHSVEHHSHSLISTVLSTASFPWHLFIKYLSLVSGLTVRCLTQLGAAPPPGYIRVEKLKELNSIVNHMHTREDLYRRAIRELQEELEQKDSDRKKALKKLKITKNEINSLGHKLEELQSHYEQQQQLQTGLYSFNDSAGEHDAGLPHTNHSKRTSNLTFSGLSLIQSPFTVHATAVISALSVWYFSQTDHAALHWKLVFSMFFPLVWFYVSWLTSRGPRSEGKRSLPLLMLGACWFLIGFAVALSLGHGPLSPHE